MGYSEEERESIDCVIEALHTRYTHWKCCMLPLLNILWLLLGCFRYPVEGKDLMSVAELDQEGFQESPPTAVVR